MSPTGTPIPNSLIVPDLAIAIHASDCSPYYNTLNAIIGTRNCFIHQKIGNDDSQWKYEFYFLASVTKVIITNHLDCCQGYVLSSVPVLVPTSLPSSVSIHDPCYLTSLDPIFVSSSIPSLDPSSIHISVQSLNPSDDPSAVPSFVPSLVLSSTSVPSYDLSSVSRGLPILTSSFT